MTTRRFFGTLLNAEREGRIGERRQYGSWIVERTAAGWVARVGNALRIEDASLGRLLDRVDAAGRDC